MAKMVKTGSEEKGGTATKAQKAAKETAVFRGFKIISYTFFSKRKEGKEGAKNVQEDLKKKRGRKERAHPNLSWLIHY